MSDKPLGMGGCEIVQKQSGEIQMTITVHAVAYESPGIGPQDLIPETIATAIQAWLEPVLKEKGIDVQDVQVKLA